MNLSGINYNVSGLSLSGQSQLMTTIYQGANPKIKQLNDLKTYLNETFVQPLLIRDMEFIQNNKYNFTYLNEQLLKYKHLDKKEVELYMNIVRFAQEAIVIMAKNEELEQKLYNNEGFMGIVTHIPSIILKPEFEIYKTFFGMPPAGKFDVNAINTIKNILENNLGSNYKVIEDELLKIYNDPIKENSGGFEWAVPLKRVKSNEQNLPFLGDNYHMGDIKGTPTFPSFPKAQSAEPPIMGRSFPINP